jgi:ADP-ribose pyrophosphatase
MKKKLIETTTSSEVVFQGRFLRVWRDEVDLPNGHQSYREYIKHPGAAMVIPKLDNGKFLMIHQYRHAVGQVFLEFPAGKTDAGESTLMTAERELQEEVGYKAGKLTFLTHIHPVIGYSNERIDLYLAENLSPAPATQDPDEILENVELSLDEIEAKIWNHEISDVKTQIGAFWLLKKMKGTV